jgi:hypothetical protein
MWEDNNAITVEVSQRLDAVLSAGLMATNAIDAQLAIANVPMEFAN